MFDIDAIQVLKLLKIVQVCKQQEFRKVKVNWSLLTEIIMANESRLLVSS